MEYIPQLFSENRPPYHEVYLSLATIVSKSSHDSQTKCGCVLVKRNRVISTGYNSPARDLPLSYIPNTRPEKYHWMIHAEQNAISNALLAGVNTEDAVAYINAKPCFRCLTQELWHNRIKTVYYYDGVKPQYSEDDEHLTSMFMYITDNQMHVHKIDFDFNKYIKEYHETTT